MSAETERHAVCCELVDDVASIAGAVRLRVTGASMLPALWPGDVIAVEYCGFAGLRTGQVVLFRRDGGLTAHRIRGFNGDRVLTRGDSNPCFDPPVKAEEIVGRIVNVTRGGCTFEPKHSLWQRLAAALLGRSDFLIRVTLLLSSRLRRSWKMRESWT
jgi:signal peptidase